VYTISSELSVYGVTAQSLGLDEAGYSLLLSQIISTAKSMIDAYCKQSFEPMSTIEIIDGNGNTTLFPNHSPILTLTQILLEGDDITADCLLYRSYISYPASFTKGKQNIEISYTFGFNEVPQAIKDVSFQICKRLLYKFKAEKNAQGMTSERLDDYQYSIDTSETLTEDLKIMLSPFTKKGGIV
jgi:hypothetical protein